MENNIPMVTVDQFRRIAELQFNEGERRPLFGLGLGGIGKSECIHDLCADLGIGHIDIRLLTYSEVDLKGIPYPNEENTKSIWLQNDVLPNAGRDGERGILVLDEITSVARSVRTAAYQLLNERKLGEYTLPDGWMIICLGNGEEEGGDFQGMEGNFVNRCGVFHVSPDIAAWKAWAAGNGVNELVLAYISWRNEELHTYNPESETELAFASPRSWKAVSDILNRYGYREDDEITRLRVLSNVGIRSGEQFWAFCKYRDQAVSPEDILSGRAAPNQPDANAQDGANTDDDATQQPSLIAPEMLHITMQGVVRGMSVLVARDYDNGELQAGTIASCANGIKWILALPGMENRVVGIRDFALSNRDAVAELFLNDAFDRACPELAVFARENAAIFKGGS